MTRTFTSPGYARVVLLTSIAGLLFLVACDPADSASSADAATPTAQGAATPVVLVTADEYSYTMPDTIVSGVTTFRLTDAGQEPHHLMLVRLDSGHTVDDLMAVMSSHSSPVPEWAVFVGGPNSPAPGSTESSEVTLELAPGNYVALCMVPAPDGVPHVAKGMMKPFTVVASDNSDATPEADVEMKLVDYDYSMNTPITAGRQVIRVVNEAQQQHEVIFVRFGDGESIERLLEWERNPTGPLPATPMGGTAPMDPGMVNYVTVNFEPGTYALICFVPDAGDGMPHTQHGMVKTITVE